MTAEKNGKNSGLKKPKTSKIIATVLFGVILPIATIAGIILLINNGAFSGLVSDDASNNIEETQVTSFSFSPTEESDADASGTKAEEDEDFEKNILSIPDIPAAYCVSPDPIIEQGEVIAVLDSQTLFVDTGEEVISVRYLGIETPTIDELGGQKAFETNSSLTGQNVILVGDGPDQNDAGEYLRYVFTNEFFINFQMAEWGLANASHEAADLDCGGFFLAAETTAKEQEIGMWEYVDVRMDPEDWRNWPIVPLFSKNAIEIYERAVEAGRDPNHYSIMGDCQAPTWRMFGHFEYQSFSLPDDYAYLQPTLDRYSGQWTRDAVTVNSGFTVASLFATAWSNRELCGAAETPIDCEIRINNSPVSLIMLGTNWGSGRNEEFDTNLRNAVTYMIDHNVLPIIVTKGEATDPDFPLNQIMAEVAYDYDIPLWNFWAGIQDLDNHGLETELLNNIYHLSIDSYPIKRWTGLQTLQALNDAVYGPIQ
ncbi:MAG: hypothetical protein HON98_10775 [Chloroflexi bacterium]|jgi:endonuclease YncB( thermonuclease family)|nr:hypothetical protein [Chloroflexota bacterium]MBT3670704.1 hypothetical protein [Chloroflexota bacterium]MBT4306260.1 hypothetical protein [Chloroflexota bacterium]MBT4532859.1 hypothetical protein [Chloroflexota bacterium]MBT4684081.1 hypothetical protein [Chloroflexota bacterium]